MTEIRLVAISGLLAWSGATLVFGEIARISRSRLVERLLPYGNPGRPPLARTRMTSVETFGEVIGPLSRSVGERLSRMFGVTEELAVRLYRIHSSLDVTAYRIRQLGWCLAAIAVVIVSTVLLHLPPILGLLGVPGAALLAFLAAEQRIASASAAWQRRIFLELPVVSEQLAMLLSSGYSLGSAIGRIGERGRGACARDLARVRARLLQGRGEVDALREWASVAQVEAVDRVVAILSLNSEAADLGRLISEEARSVRRDVQRTLVEAMERRSQQVWIPVTVATLVPGVIFLVVPFVDALRLFAGS